MNLLVTGGAGFIGCNTAKVFGEQGWRIALLDNLSRAGSLHNLNWLRKIISFEFFKVDVRDPDALGRLIGQGQFNVVIHLAGQVAVTTSVRHPKEDFEINTIGTFNLLEAIRCHCPHTIFVNASTNKVYGKLRHLPVREETTRYRFVGPRMSVSEEEALDFCSPYACSKGAAEQYVIDYARTYGMKCVSFRQSCIYGERQFGLEDQGWAAWLLYAHLSGKPITVFGNGKQVRDMLHVGDLIKAYQSAIENIDVVSEGSFNIGGGPDNSISLLEYFELLKSLTGRKVSYSTAEFRTGDQPVYISDIRKARAKLDWEPTVMLKQGLSQLYEWVTQNEEFQRHV